MEAARWCLSLLRGQFYRHFCPLAGYLTFTQDNAGVLVNPKGEMKGSAITGPVAKECVRDKRAYCSSDSYAYISPYRLTCGRVSHQTQALSFERHLSTFLSHIYSCSYVACAIITWHYDQILSLVVCDYSWLGLALACFPSGQWACNPVAVSLAFMLCLFEAVGQGETRRVLASSIPNSIFTEPSTHGT